MTNNKSAHSASIVSFEYLRERFLKKNGRYIDTWQNHLPQFQDDDLLSVLRSAGLTVDQCNLARQGLRKEGLRVWSGRAVFRPDAPRIIEHDGMCAVNTWKAPETNACPGDARPFLDYLSRLVPVETEREWLLNFLAHRYQHPAVKPFHGVILYGAQQGTGKSTLGEIIEVVFGNTNRVTSADGLVGRFCAPNWGRAWVVAEEIKVTAGGTTYNALKDLITAETRQSERKGQDFAEFETPAALLLLSNYEPSFIEPDDRRFFIVEVTTSDSREALQAYFSELRRWLENEDGYSIIAGHLKHRDMGSYSPRDAPPVTETKRKLVGLVQTGLQQKVSDWLEDRGRNVVTDEELEREFAKISTEQLRHLLSRAGWVRFTEGDSGRVTLNKERHRFWLRESARILLAPGKKALFVDIDGTDRPLEEVMKHGHELL